MAPDTTACTTAWFLSESIHQAASPQGSADGHGACSDGPFGASFMGFFFPLFCLQAFLCVIYQERLRKWVIRVCVREREHPNLHSFSKARTFVGREDILAAPHGSGFGLGAGWCRSTRAGVGVCTARPAVADLVERVPRRAASVASVHFSSSSSPFLTHSRPPPPLGRSRKTVR